MNRWNWVAVVAMTVALPALAQDRWRDWERERGRDFREQVVSIEKRRMQWKLERVDRRLGDLIARARPPDRKALKDLRDELTDVRDLLNAAQPVGMVGPGGPPPLMQPPAVQPGPPPPVYQPQQPPPGYQQPPPQGFQPAVMPIADPAFRNILGAMSCESFADDKLRVLDSAASTNFFLVAQVQQVLAQFNFPGDRLKAVRILRPRILDTDNAFQLYGAFEFPRDKEELKRILGQ